MARHRASCVRVSARSCDARRRDPSCAAACAGRAPRNAARPGVRLRRGPRDVAELVHQPIDVATRITAASRPDSGAIAVFLGTTRDHHQGRRVTGLAYEAYEPMALDSLAAIERA